MRKKYKQIECRKRILEYIKDHEFFSTSDIANAIGNGDIHKRTIIKVLKQIEKENIITSTGVRVNEFNYMRV